MRPALVTGSWATTHPPGRTAASIRRRTATGECTCSSTKRQKARSTGSGSVSSSPCLGEGHDLGLGRFGGGRRHLVAPGRIGVDRVHPSVAADDAGQRNRHVSASRPDVGAPPTLSQAQSVQGGGQRPAVDVVAKLQLDHAWHDRTLRRGGPAVNCA